ncbi:MAG: ribosomal protein S18 acetylase RimI-like enzyme [Pseudohongiellaceae bacterium]|jgi:ribosomal protein S18 acetylase RimI-like enzyme
MIEIISSNNLDEILPLIKSYQEFYNAVPTSLAHNKIFFSQFNEESSAGCQFLYRKNNEVAGFATVYFTFNSNVAAKIAILNDLYVIPAFRGQQIARQLIEYCREFAQARGAVRLQWVTAPDNLVAQKLYDSLDVKKSEWAFYIY